MLNASHAEDRKPCLTHHDKPEMHILCVDDESIILLSLREELRSHAHLLGASIDIATSGAEALRIMEEITARGEEIPVIISDQRMPGMNGDEFLSRAQTLVPDARKIMLTGYTDLGAVTRLVNKDALYRYVVKPWEHGDLVLTVQEAFRSYKQERLVRCLSDQNEKLSCAMVAALESANFAYDEETGRHIRRLSEFSALIAAAYGLDDDFVRRIRLYASLHDIGKIGIPKTILAKPARLSPEEFERVKQHVEIGYNILRGDDIDLMAKNITLYHHEKWNGGGYLGGLSGGEIPLEARIVCIADVFDALVSERVYKPSMPIDEAIALIQDGSGTMFDPDLVSTFMESAADIRKLYADL